MQTKPTNINLAIYQFFKTQLEVFRGYFIVTNAIQDEEAIHQMRVAIKRIRSIRKLIDHFNYPGMLTEEQYTEIKSLFAASGRLRDLHVQQKLLKKFTKLLEMEFVDFSDYLNEKEVQLSNDLRQYLASFNLHQFDGSENEKKLADIPKDTVGLEKEGYSFLKAKLEKIQLLIQTMKQDELVHDMRKQVKHLFFILHFFSTYFPEREICSYDIKILKGFGERLGAWNDRDVLQSSLYGFIDLKGNNYFKKKPEYQRLLEFIEEKKYQYLQDVDTELKLELDKIGLMLGTYGDQ